MVAADRKPNIIVIFTDDHGYADLSCQGVFDDVRTPYMDSLARGGVRMTSGYATAPQCGPSRAGLISGQYQNKFGLDANGAGREATQRFWDLPKYPEKGAALRTELEAWSQTLYKPGIPDKLPVAGSKYFDWYLDGIRNIPVPSINTDEAPQKRKRNRR